MPIFINYLYFVIFFSGIVNFSGFFIATIYLTGNNSWQFFVLKSQTIVKWQFMRPSRLSIIFTGGRGVYLFWQILFHNFRRNFFLSQNWSQSFYLLYPGPPIRRRNQSDPRRPMKSDRNWNVGSALNSDNIRLSRLIFIWEKK